MSASAPASLSRRLSAYRAPSSAHETCRLGGTGPVLRGRRVDHGRGRLARVQLATRLRPCQQELVVAAWETAGARGVEELGLIGSQG